MLPPLVADVNIAFSVVRFLRSQGIDIAKTRQSAKKYDATGCLVLTLPIDYGGGLEAREKGLVVYWVGTHRIE